MHHNYQQPGENNHRPSQDAFVRGNGPSTSHVPYVQGIFQPVSTVPTYGPRDPNIAGSYSPLYHTVQYSAPSSRMALPNAAQGTLVPPNDTRGNHASDNNNRAPGQQPSNVGSSGDSHSSKGSIHVAGATRNPQQVNQTSAAANSHVLQSAQQSTMHNTLQSYSSEGGAANQLHAHKIQRPIQPQQQSLPQQRQQPQHPTYPSLANLHVATQHPNAPPGIGGGVLGHYVPASPYAAMNLWQPGHPGHAPAVPSLRASAPEIDAGRGGAASGTSGRRVPDWSATSPVQAERRGRASFSGQAATVCISGPVGGGLSSREPERRSMDRTPRRIQPGAAERAVQPLQRQHNPTVTEGHFRAAAAAAAATSQLWGMEGVAAGSTPFHPSFSVSQKGVIAPERRSFSEGSSASTRSLPVALVAEEVAELPRQRATESTEASELDPAQAGHVSAIRPSAPGFLTKDSHGAISTTGGVVNPTTLSEIGQLRREVEELRSQVLVLRASLECRDQDVARLNRQLQEVEINGGGRGKISIHGPGTDMNTVEMRAVLSTEQMLQDGKEWDRRTSVDSQDSVLFSSLRHEPHSTVTPSSSIHLPRPPPMLLETVPGLSFNATGTEAQNGRGSQASISVEHVPGKEDDRREVLHLRERLSAIEEALQLMRDEARARTPTVEAADISFVRLLGRGSFAEVHRAIWRIPCAVKRLRDGVRANQYEARKFHREASLLRSLLHPGVLRVFGFCKADFLLITEVVEGGSLHNLIHSSPHTKLQHSVVLQFAAQVADILRYLHLCRVVHRDLKPENLLVDSAAGSILKLADFGLACEKHGEYIKTQSNLAGTPRYMAPEAYRDELCTEKIDIYSFAMLTWEMLTGQLPWDGSNFQDVRHAVACAGERPPTPPNTPLPLAELITDCWHADPEERPSATEILARISEMGVRSKFQDIRSSRIRWDKTPQTQDITSSKGSVGLESVLSDGIHQPSRDHVKLTKPVAAQACRFEVVSLLVQPKYYWP
eukprot:CAMPEP_0172198500 /NCGR_PEP_ID=MMETSP1050-20130122/28125_1 /TAXON_ID=233186 /ORGANISM="Cryptomonas curvata, Strain CCAP979/52" /LENGTH=1002 /DNA_ID=CAMNT_0012875335 /DNA_START=44 /DNA_END=3055 /DNA_ORIENTATION=-